MPEYDEDDLRKKVWRIVNLLQANQLFVHSSTISVKYVEGKKVKTQLLPEIITIACLNALVPNSALLLVGGHGGGKTSLVKLMGRMFTGLRLDQIEEGIVRGHPQLTEEKLIGTLKISKLMKEGIEEVVWRDFVVQFWKIIDEVNRLTPYAQDILLSLLAEGRVKYYDAVYEISRYCLYATINPKDVGTHELSLPFLDRFGMSIPISMPTSHDISIILKSRDEKFAGYDELVQVPQIMTINELLNAWYYVNKVDCSTEAEDFIHAITREFSLCERVDKGNTDKLKPGSGLCAGCHFNVERLVCNKVESILSVRVAKDLLRYSKALAWLLDLDEVDIHLVSTIAPYVINHRVRYVERALEKAPFYGNALKFTSHLIDLVRKRFVIREKAYEIVQEFRNGGGTKAEVTRLKEMAKNDLIVQHDLLPLVSVLSDSKYQKKVNAIHGADESGDIKALSKYRDELLEDLTFPNRGDLIAQINRALYKHTVTSYNFTFREWKTLWVLIAAEFAELDKPLRGTLESRQAKQIRTRDMVLFVNVTGTQPEDIVNLEVYGGSDAVKLKETLETRGGA
ncbi:MAG: AAA family ATPase [Promethearchaeota archaeon]